MQKPIHVYLDLDVINNNLSSTAAAPVLTFQENRNSPFLDGDSSEYFCSIVRFSIQTANSLPIFIPRIQIGQTNVDLTVYQITMEWRFPGSHAAPGYDYTSSTYLFHNPSDLTAPPPQTPLVSQDLTSTYYYYYNVQDVIDMFNQGLTTVFDNIAAQITDPNQRNYFTSFYVPYFAIDPGTYLITLYVDKNFVNPQGSIQGFIYFNARLYHLLSSLHSISFQTLAMGTTSSSRTPTAR